MPDNESHCIKALLDPYAAAARAFDKEHAFALYAIEQMKDIQDEALLILTARGGMDFESTRKVLRRITKMTRDTLARAESAGLT